MRFSLIISCIFFGITSASADHFNQRNIIEECAQDTSFNSICYTYIAAQKDFLAFWVRATEEDRMRSLCLYRLTTKRLVERLAQSEPLTDSYQVPYLIFDEFCN